ncbi:MAG: hypothetical protein GY737_23615 [Desulfobacteraceae bacterium]|nr:hypothetical protein [Desulfobacteraceae bacterium]
MILHDTIYEWDGKCRNGEKPVAWWPGAYRIRIVDLTAGKPDLLHLKSRAVICRNQDKGTSIRNCIQNFALKVAKRFGLDVARVLWVEIENDDPQTMQVANLTRVTVIAGKELLSASWRPVRPNEIAFLKPFLVDFTGQTAKVT